MNSEIEAAVYLSIQESSSSDLIKSDVFISHAKRGKPTEAFASKTSC